MDFDRWGLQKLIHLKDRYSDFRDFLAEILEGDRSLVSDYSKNESTRGHSEVALSDEQNIAPAFQVRNDMRVLLAQPLPVGRKGTIKVEALFESLAPFYEAGFLLCRSSDGKIRLRSTFVYGQKYSASEKAGIIVDVSLPDHCNGGIKSGRIKPLLKSLNMDSIQSLHDSAVFIFEPIENEFFVLVCGRAGPWQMNAIEETFLVVNEILELSRKGNLR